MKRWLYILFLVLLALPLHAQQSYHARVVDAETGEALPFVNVYQASGKGCVTNLEGDFTIMADSEDSLRFSFVGYKTSRWKAGEMPGVVKMHSSALSIAGVTVLSDEAILTRAYKTLKGDLKAHGREQRRYLNRITIRSGKSEEMVEDFLTARSAVNVRSLRVTSGQYWTRMLTGEQVASQMERTNLHNLMTAGPLMRQVPLEDYVIQPFPDTFSSSFLNHYYAHSSQTLQADGGGLVHVVELRPKVDTWKGILYGKLYIDSRTFRLLRFDGAVRGIKLNVSRLGAEADHVHPATVRVQVHYTHKRGFTEVEKASVQIHTDGLDVSMTLTDAEGITLPSGKGVLVKENLLKAILAAGTHPYLQQETGFMQRTALERAIAGDMPNVPTASAGQSAPPLFPYLQKAMNFNKVVPQEKVYLHFDNMGYFENETLWFKAYVTRTDNGHLSDLSKVLYVELLNPSGDIVKTCKYPVDSLGVSHGDIKLDSLLTSGYYEVRAYTRYMTNWGTNAVFSRVFPVFKKPAKEGDYSDLTIRTMLYYARDPNNRTSDDSLYQRAIEEGIYTHDLMKTVSVKFYPEGGDLILGKKCRVAVLAVDDNGHPYEGEGFVMNGRGDVLASVKTDTLGRGLFELVPDTGKLTFQMRNLKKSTRRSVQYFTLPEAKREGCTLSVDAVSEQMLATLQCSDGICGSMLGYVIMHSGNIYRCDTLTASPLMEIELDRQAMPEGVNQMTVFDSRGAIMAERLFFICPKPDKSDSIQVTAITKRLKPCGKVELELQTKPNANLSFSAMDAKTMTNGKQGNMKTWMLLSSEVRGYIHNVDYYFEADDKEHRQNADLLMLTQGWRRYDWRLMSEKYTFRKAQPIEDQFYLYGKLNTYRKRNPVSNVHLYAILYNQKGQSLIGNTRTDSVGRYAFKLPFITDEWKMCIYTTRDGKKKGLEKKEKLKTYYVGIDRQFSPEARYLTPEEREIQHPLKPNAFVKKPFEELEEEDEFIPITEKDHVLQPTIFEFLAKNNRQFDNPECIGLPAGPGGAHGHSMPPLGEWWSGGMTYNNHAIRWIVDNGESQCVGLYTNTNYAAGDYFFPMFMSDIKSLYIVPADPRDVENVSRIYLYTHRKFSSESNKGLRRTYFQGFNQASTFKTEDYSVIPPMADFRRTICKEMYLSVEGMTPDGKILINE